MAAVNYRFYILNRHEQIIGAEIVACDGTEEIERTAYAVLTKRVDSAVVEVWEQARPIYRTKRSKVTS